MDVWQNTFLTFIITSCFFSSSLYSQTKYWIEFKDKGIPSQEFKPGNPIFDNTLKEFSPKALKRRAETFGTQKIASLITIEDAPVSKKYLSFLMSEGIKVITISNWANAVSAYLSEQQIKFLQKQTFILRVKPLAVSKDTRQSIEEAASVFFLSSIVSDEVPEVLPIPAGYDTIINHYGLTGEQLRRINVPPLHAMGFDGRGVMLGYLDVGFRWRAMRTTKMHHVVAEYDFIFQDSSVSNDSLDLPNQDGHGSGVLSAATGFMPDSIIGPAFHPDLLLAKTEDLRSETPREEDHYAAALEWMEKLGVDITSASLGYFKFDDGFTSYTYSDMDGKTTISAKASARAAKLGVLCCAAMGNNGGDINYPYMITPADADSIISVGALEPNDSIANFSAKGPTFDKRLKPEICAPGVGIWTMNALDTFQTQTGTSLATPLVSGACALIKQAHPEASAQSIRTAVMRTGILSPGHLPDTAYGYGRLDTYNAALSLGTIIGTMRRWKIDSIHHVEIGIAANNKVRNPKIIYAYNIGGLYNNTLPLSLATDSLIYTAVFPPLRKGSHVRYYVETKDGADTITRYPRNAPDSVFDFYIGDTVVNPPFDVKARPSEEGLSLSPNPAQKEITIRTQTDESIVYTFIDALGREILHYEASPNIRELRIRLSRFSAGAYQLHAHSVSGKFNKIIKFIVL